MLSQTVFPNNLFVASTKLITLESAFADRLVSTLVELPCRLLTEDSEGCVQSEKEIWLTCAVTDKLNSDCLLSLKDYDDLRSCKAQTAQGVKQTEVSARCVNERSHVVSEVRVGPRVEKVVVNATKVENEHSAAQVDYDYKRRKRPLDFRDTWLPSLVIFLLPSLLFIIVKVLLGVTSISCMIVKHFDFEEVCCLNTLLDMLSITLLSCLIHNWIRLVIRIKRVEIFWKLYFNFLCWSDHDMIIGQRTGRWK
jgi:hypothetical protein